MRICFLAPADNHHTQKWCRWFSSHGNEVHVISFTEGEIENCDVCSIESGASPSSSDYSKLRYLFAAGKVRRKVEEIRPDIINVHYATSYGTVAALAGLRNYVLSVWGADVYDFPRKGILHNLLLRYSLSRASFLFSTSRTMADEVRKYTRKNIEITPFGVDMNLFNPDKRKTVNGKKFIVGTVKALQPKYGIDYFLKAMAIVKMRRPDIDFEVRIAGKGEMEGKLRKLSSSLGLSDSVVWLGYISQDRAAEEWANMDLAVVYSTLDSESFGVSAVEAEASGCPVIISDAPGLMEATEPGGSSVVVGKCNEDALASAIIDLYDKKEKRREMGMRGREYVLRRFEIDMCFSHIEDIYRKIMKDEKMQAPSDTALVEES